MKRTDKIGPSRGRPLELCDVGKTEESRDSGGLGNVSCKCARTGKIEGGRR